jgi:hypothetical protein
LGILEHHTQESKEDDKLGEGTQNQEETRDINANERVETPLVKQDQG